MFNRKKREIADLKKQLEGAAAILHNRNSVVANLFIRLEGVIGLAENLVRYPMAGQKASIQEDLRGTRIEVERLAVDLERLGIVRREKVEKPPEESKILAPTPDNIRSLVVEK